MGVYDRIKKRHKICVIFSELLIAMHSSAISVCDCCISCVMILFCLNNYLILCNFILVDHGRI